MQKIFVYHAPQRDKKQVKVTDIKTVERLMSMFMNKAAGVHILNVTEGNVCDILPGGEDANEAFTNAALLQKLAEEAKPIQLMKLPCDDDYKIANISKYLFDFLQNEHGKGNALTMHDVHKTVEDLVKSIQGKVEETSDHKLADFLFNMGVANKVLVADHAPSIFSKTTPLGSLLSPTVIKLKAEDFIREQYPESYVFSDIDEIIELIGKFNHKYPLGVPKDTVEGIFLEVCPMK